MRYILSILLIVSVTQANDLKSGIKAIENGDLKAAFAAFKCAAEAGEKLAQFNLGVMYNNGYGTQKDTDLASYWLKQAADKRMMYTR